MKIAVLADVHSNLSALQAVIRDVEAWEPHRVIAAGDIVNRGPLPRPCLELLLEKQEQGWLLMRGNHEDFVLLETGAGPARPEWERKLCQHTRWTNRQIHDYLGQLEKWPHRIELPGPDGQTLLCVHASMHSNRTGLYPRMNDEEMAPLVSTAPSLLCVGHTHVPFVRHFGHTLIVNVGAVGLPFDRDPRASYARIEWTAAGWQSEIVRLSYDRARTEQAFFTQGYLEEGGPMVALILDELRQARPRLGPWHRDYESRVAAGEISIEDSVNELLAEVA